jgi:hypothetical protein
MKSLWVGLVLKICIFSFLFAAVLPASSWAIDPSIDWRQIETEHFTVVFDSKHYDLAKLYAVQAEQAFKAVAPVFGVWPDKTVVVINDSYDITNGAAGAVPYPMILSFPVLPSPLDTIGDYGNWGLELLTHEYTHILNFEPATGVMRPLRWVFGSLIRPNSLLPRWYLEGLAVYMETRYSHYGRLRSPNYLSIPRALLEDDRLGIEDIGRINEVGIPDFPGGDRPYLMGALLWNEMIHERGEGVVGDLNLTYSHRMPFFLDGPAKERFDAGYQGLLDRAYQHASDSAKKQVGIIHTAGVIRETPFAQKGIANRSPVISSDGLKMISVVNDPTIDSYILLHERASTSQSFQAAPSRIVASGTMINRAAWLPNSTSFIYDAIDIHARYYEYSDLWRVDLDGKKKKRSRLTQGLRAREAAVSPDGKSIVFVQLSAGATALASVNVDGSGFRQLYVPALQVRVSNPEFLSNSEIIYSERSDEGLEFLRVLHLAHDTKEGGGLLASGRPRDVLKGFAPAHTPKLTREGVLFTSDKSGVANLYLANRDLSDAKAVTNTTTRIVTGDLDPSTGELIYSRLTSKGPFLYSSAKSDWIKTPDKLPQTGSLVDTEWPSYSPPKVTVNLESEDYNPFPYLLPTYWLPFAYFAPDRTYFQASTSGSDPVGHHSYSLGATYDTLTAKPSFAGQYVNQTTAVPISLSGADYYEYIYTGGLRRHTTEGTLAGSFFLPGLNNEWRGGLAWNYLQQELFGQALVRNGVRASVLWSNVQQMGEQISPEKGGSVLLSHTRYLAGLGNIDYEQTDVGATAYISKWLTDYWPQRHVLAVSVHGTYAPRLSNALLGQSSVEGTTATGIIPVGFVMRGYSSGVFLGKNLLAGTLEYRFPIAYTYKSFGLHPLFLNRIHADVFADGLTLDGLGYDHSANLYRTLKFGIPYYGVGAEVKFDTTVFYHLPMQLLVGAYYGTDPQYNPYGLFPFVGIGI